MIDKFVIIEKNDDIHLVSGGEEVLQVWFWGRRIDNYKCFAVIDGGLEPFYIPYNLSELINR